MELSDFLELNLLANNDYAKHWDIPVNGNFKNIDSECEEIATELLADPTLPYDGKLRGSAASLEDRLNVAMDANGNILYNDYDLEKSRYSRKPWTVPSNIHSRLSMLDSEEYVNDAIKTTLGSGSGADASHKYVKYRHDRSAAVSTVTPQTMKYSSGMGVDLGAFYFRTKNDTDLVSYDNITGEVTIQPLGLMQIGGNLYKHTVPCTYSTTPGVEYMLSLYAMTYKTGAEIDTQFIRDSVVTGNTGSATIGTSVFSSVNIGANLWPGVNNKWTPTEGQILRLSDGAVTYDYYIKTVNTDSVEISGKFDRDFAAGTSWSVYDFSQPLILIIPRALTWATVDTVTSSLGASAQYLLSLGEIVISTTGSHRASFFRQTNPLMKNAYVYPVTFFSDGDIGVPGGVSETIALDNDTSMIGIKSIGVIAVERKMTGFAPTEFKISYDPTRALSISAGPNYYLHSYQVYIKGTLHPAMTNINGWDITSNELEIVHPDYEDGGGAGSGSGWSMSSATSGYSLEYLGIVVQLL